MTAVLPLVMELMEDTLLSISVVRSYRGKTFPQGSDSNKAISCTCCPGDRDMAPYLLMS